MKEEFPWIDIFCRYYENMSMGSKEAHRIPDGFRFRSPHLCKYILKTLGTIMHVNVRFSHLGIMQHTKT
jgi:hypothetical protein